MAADDRRAAADAEMEVQRADEQQQQEQQQGEQQEQPQHSDETRTEEHKNGEEQPAAAAAAAAPAAPASPSLQAAQAHSEPTGGDDSRPKDDSRDDESRDVDAERHSSAAASQSQSAAASTAAVPAAGRSASERGKVYVGNVPTSMNEDDVRELFAPVLNAGAVVDSIHFKAGPVGRFGFVHFSHSTSGLSDLVNKLNGLEWQGQKLRVEFSKTSAVKCVHCGLTNHRSVDCRGAKAEQRGPREGRGNNFRGARGANAQQQQQQMRSRSRSPVRRIDLQRGRDFGRAAAAGGFDRSGPRGPVFDAPRMDDRPMRGGDSYESRGSYPPPMDRDRDWDRNGRDRERMPLPPLDRDRAFGERDRAFPDRSPVDRYGMADRERDRDRAYPPVGSAYSAGPMGAYGGRRVSPSPPPRRPLSPLGPLRRRSRSRSRSPSAHLRSRGRSPPPPIMPNAGDRRSGPPSSYAPPYPVSAASAYPPSSYGASDSRDRPAYYSAAPVYGERERSRERDTRDAYPARDSYARDAYAAYPTPARDAPRDLPREVNGRDLPPRSSPRDAGPRDRDVPRDAYLAPAAGRGDRERDTRRDDRRDDSRLDADSRGAAADPRVTDPRATAAQAAAYAQWYSAYSSYAAQAAAGTAAPYAGAYGAPAAAYGTADYSAAAAPYSSAYPSSAYSSGTYPGY